ncbi:MAG: hypothetical protein ACK4TL_19010 [Hyphomicrobiaceae bacterium]
MKTILSTIVAVGLLSGAAHANFDPFSDARQALPRATGHEQALPYAGNGDHRQALPRSGNGDFRDALPVMDAAFPDVVIAKP